MSVRLVTWNCRLGVDDKRALFDRLRADILVVPECPKNTAFSREDGVSFAWRGRYDMKGLGVFALDGWRVAPATERAALPWVLPLRVFDPDGREVALLLAVWTVAAAGSPSYADQIAAVLAEWRTEIRDGETIIAGDFNCAGQTSKPAKHLRNVAEFGRLGAVSAYHHVHGAEHGREEAMTLRWIGRGGEAVGFHCDFVFASAALTPRIELVEVGAFAEWIEAGHSDHCPVGVQFA